MNSVSSSSYETCHITDTTTYINNNDPFLSYNSQNIDFHNNINFVGDGNLYYFNEGG